MLARTLGRTLDELGQTMSAAEFSEHWDDYRRSPWGERRADLHAALVAQTTANYAGKMRKDAAKLTDFLLEFEPRGEAEPEPDPAAFFGPLLK